MSNLIINCLTSLIFLMSFPELSYSRSVGDGIILEIKKGERTVGYLVGTMHKFPKDDGVNFSEKFKEVLAKSDGVVTELGVAQFVQFTESTNQALARAMSGKHLSSVISQKLYRNLENHFSKQFGSDTSRVIENSHPFGIGNAILANCSVEGNPVTMDETLALMASSADRPLLALESVDQQVQALPQFESKVWESYLESLLTFSNTQNCTNSYEKIARSFASRVVSGRWEELISVQNENYEILDTREFDLLFIYGRNLELFSHMMKRLSSGKQFVYVFGALHLIGNDGIIAMLREKGFVVEDLR